MIPAINQRISALIESLQESNNKFARRIGTSSAVISHIVTGRNKPNIDLLYKILQALPNVNIQWLILGQGSMLLDPDSGPDDFPDNAAPDLETENPDKGETEHLEKDLAELSSVSKEDWDHFLHLMEQMLDSQKLAHQSMEENLSTQKAMLRWFRSFLKR